MHSLLFSFKSYEPCCFIHHFVDVACKLVELHNCELPKKYQV